MRIRHILPVALATLCFTACGEDTDPTGGEPTPVAKADCPDCDPAGPGAFEQTGVGDGFYEVGDTWLVAHRVVSSPELEKRGDVFLGTDVVESEAFAFRYRVLSVDSAMFERVEREVATIEVVQGTPTGANAALFNPARLDRFEHKVVFELNDLLDPVRETTYSRDYPNGKSVRLDATSSLSERGSVFPRTIPRLLVAGGVASPPPELPADLADIVDAYDPDWASASYLKYVFDNGDLVYWSKDRGQYWPFYVATARAASVLVKWN